MGTISVGQKGRPPQKGTFELTWKDEHMGTGWEEERHVQEEAKIKAQPADSW